MVSYVSVGNMATYIPTVHDRCCGYHRCSGSEDGDGLDKVHGSGLQQFSERAEIMLGVVEQI